MSINPITNRTTTAATSLTIQTTTSSTTGSVDASQEQAPVHMSEGAQMLQKLSALAKDDPAKFKEITASISEQLGAEAEKGGDGAEFLQRMADRFASASQSGDASTLQPPHHGHGDGKGPPPVGAAAAYRPQQDDAARASFEATRKTVNDIITKALAEG
jgi:hypothetical protein